LLTFRNRPLPIQFRLTRLAVKTGQACWRRRVGTEFQLAAYLRYRHTGHARLRSLQESRGYYLSSLGRYFAHAMLFQRRSRLRFKATPRGAASDRPEVWPQVCPNPAPNTPDASTAVTSKLCGFRTAPNARSRAAVILERGPPPQRRRSARWPRSSPVTPPSHKGFGSRVIERGLDHEPEGTVDLDYRPDGLVCTMTLPAPTDALDG
jgi:hypothetical protein